jgi:hypothetical protein
LEYIENILKDLQQNFTKPGTNVWYRRSNQIVDASDLLSNVLQSLDGVLQSFSEMAEKEKQAEQSRHLSPEVPGVAR